MIECRLQTDRLYRFMGMVMPLVIGIATMVIGITMVLGLIQKEPGVGWLVLMVGAITAYTAWSFLRLPQTIELHDDGQMVFRGVGKPKVISALDIQSIESPPYFVGMLVVRHSGGKLSFLNQFTGFHKLLSTLETLNPNIEIKGC